MTPCIWIEMSTRGLRILLTQTTQLNSTQQGTMTPASVERMLIDDARLLVRRDEQIDVEMENERRRCLELFYQGQDGMLEFQCLVPFCVVLDKKCRANRDLIKWLRKFSIKD